MASAQFDLVATIFGMKFGDVSVISAVVYGLVGVAGISARRIQMNALSIKALRSGLFVMAMSAALSLSLPSGGFTQSQPSPAKDIVDTAVAAGSFKTLAAALQAAGVVDTLKGKGPYTVFAPTDEAFAKLPAGTLQDLLKPENKSKLAAILTYHVVPGKVLAPEVTKMNSAKTVNGQAVTIKVSGATVTVDNAKVVKTDILCSKGVIHVIDSVVLPK